MKTLRTAIISASLLMLSSCGGGGGGGSDFIGAAEVSVRVSPHKIDTGDRAEVSIDVSTVHPNGIFLKVRIPKALSYVLNSAELEIDGQNIDIGPKKNVTKDAYTYVVFIFSQDDFGSDNRGKVRFQLAGNSAIQDGLVEVDADVNDPLVNDNNEFNVDSPEFGAESDASIEVTQ